MSYPSWRPARIEVEVGSLVVDDPLLARRGEIAAALARELERIAAGDGVAARPRRPVTELSVGMGGAASTRSVGKAIGRAVGEELSR